ncbi:Hypothetical predicted protein [Mytilus galloprovincialis]|uniref:Uncharacterized protein n=1 Tax=Mytilus galloprovincialis TaxID=29158 RepID=A0A8B6HIQ8_MYTGA|nr:Hypothetical predicted protein [Mytilus galloprovincialis]
MNKQRAIQSHICENSRQFMHIFIATLMDTLDVDQDFILFIRWLKLLLDDRSRNVIPKYLARYQREWQTFRSVKNTKDHERIDQIKHQLNESEYELAEASFGFEHLIREVGQMYEAVIEVKSNSRASSSDAYDKMMQGRQKFLETLNEMTKEELKRRK